MNLANILKASCEKNPEKIALAFYDRRISYRELYETSSRFAAALTGMGLAPGDRVGFAMPNVPEFAIALYGALAAGVEIVQINPQYTAREAGWYCEDAEIKMLIVHPFFDEMGKAIAEKYKLKLIYSDSMGDPAKFDMKKVIEDCAETLEPIERRPRDTALIVYTNAISGQPLGACLTHSGMITNADSCRVIACISEADTFLTVLPLYHAFALTTCLNLPILCGGTTVFHESFSENRVVTDLIKEKISIFPCVPTIMKRLLETHGGSGKDFSGVRAFVPGGAPSPAGLQDDFEKTFNANIYEGYGVSECGPVTTSNPFVKGKSKRGSIGLPVTGIQVRIVDDDGVDVPPGQVGELIAKGENVMEKYLNHPQETAQFLKDGWLYTGDLARMDEDAYIFLTGLKKRMMIVGGFNVYHAEVEAELMKHPAVRSCRVFPVPHSELGERVSAEVTFHPGMEVPKTDLYKFLRKSLAAYKIPKPIEVV